MIKIYKDETSCKKIWNSFSRGAVLFDDWDFRNGWNKGRGFDNYFVVSEAKNQVLACLPLAFNSGEKRYEWFGSDFMENNSIFISDPNSLKEIFTSLPSPLHLNSINGESAQTLREVGIESVLEEYHRNELDISDVESFESLVGLFSKKHRYNLLRDYKIIETLHPEVEVITKDFDSAFNLFRKLSMESFGESWNGEEGSYVNFARKSYLNILRAQNKYSCKFFIVRINDVIAAVDLIITYKDIYYLFGTAQDKRKFSGIGNYILATELKDAVQKKCTIVDCLQEDNDWKHRFFNKKDVFQIEN